MSTAPLLMAFFRLALGTAPLSGTDYARLEPPQRAAAAKEMSHEQLTLLMQDLTLDDQISAAERAMEALGDYRATLVKQERLNGKLLPLQSMEFWVRPKPWATLVHYLDGAPKGRVVLYNQALRPHQLRVREPGILSILPLWIDIDSNLTRKESTHAITEMGMGAMLAFIRKDAELVRSHGGYTRQVEGWRQDGRWCVSYIAPQGPAVYSPRTKTCSDPVSLMPLWLEVYDAAGLREHFAFGELQPAKLPEDFFTLKAAGL